MSQHPDESRIEGRSNLLPEESTQGSDDPARQAELILEDSDERTEHPERAEQSEHESTQHESSEVPD